MIKTLQSQEGRYSAEEALGRLQMHSPYSKAAATGAKGWGYDDVLKAKVYDALLEDMLAAENHAGRLANGTSIGEMVKEANRVWRHFSGRIDDVKASVFGKMMGKESAGELVSPNTVSAEQVIDQIRKMKPSQANDIMGFVSDNMPDMLPKVRGSILNDAIDAGLMGPPSGGADFMFNPNQFMSALGLKSGRAGVEGMKRLEAIFGAGTREWADMQQIVEIGRRMGDAYGKNFSGTSQGNQFYAWLKDLTSVGLRLSKRLGSTALEIGGLRRIANTMKPGHVDFGSLRRTPLIKPPRVIQGSTVPASIAAPAVHQGIDDNP